MSNSCIFFDNTEVSETEGSESSDTNTAGGSDILIDTSVLNNGEVYSSLTDMNGIDLFTSDYEELVVSYNDTNQQKSQDEVNRLFGNGFDTDVDDYATVRSLIFTDSNQSSVKKSFLSENAPTYLLYIALGCLIAIIAVVIIALINHRHKKERQHAADIYTY